MSLLPFFSKEKNIFSAGVRTMILAMAIDLLAWGFIDPFFSTFAKSLLGNLFLIGALVAIKGLVGLIALAPLSEVIRIKSPKEGAIIGRVGSLLTILFYLFGGITQSSTFLFFGSIFHGFSGAARDIALRDYLMEVSSKKNASTLLGANFSLQNTTWIIGSAASGYLLMIFATDSAFDISRTIPVLFLIALPFFLLSTFLLKKLPVTETSPFPFYAFYPMTIIQKEKELFCRFLRLDLQIKFSMLLICFLQLIRGSLLLFLPLLAFEMNLSIGQIGLLMAFMHAPLLLSAFFSIFEDRTDRMLFIIGGLLFSVIPLLLLSQVKAPFLIGISTVLISLSLAIIMPANLGTIAANTKNDDAPQIAALQIAFQWLGMLFGALLIGFISQIFGIASAFILMAILSTLFAVLAIFVRLRFKEEKKVSRAHPFGIHPLHPHLFHIHHIL